jgi:ribulose-5-phosphate 4-epimerase/fuculose-1-phosphate aldolase
MKGGDRMTRVDRLSMVPAASAEERQIRVELAACYRLIAHFGMADLIFTHITARLPDDVLLINRYGMLFDEIKASSLVRVGLNGEGKDREKAEINPAGLMIHSAVHAARPDAVCVIHTHSVAGMAVAAHAEGLLPLCQHATKFYGRLGYHDFEGIALRQEEKSRLVHDLGPHQAMILRNHGLLALGRTIAEAFHVMYHLEQACRVQVAAAASGKALRAADPAAAETAAQQFEAFPQPLGQREWPALLRMLDRIDPSYRN